MKSCTFFYLQKILMLPTKLNLIIWLVMVLMIPRCARAVHGMCCDHFDDIQQCAIIKAQEYIRSISLYNQYDTVLLCTALWLSDEVKHCYQQLRAFHYASPFQTVNNWYTQYAMSFLIMTDGTVGYDAFDWFPTLRLGKLIYKPTAIISINLPQEFQVILGKRYHSRHKYLIVFDVPLKRRPTLQVRSATVQATMTWRSDVPLQEYYQRIGKERRRIL